MSVIDVTRNHSLNLAEARQAAEALAEDLSREFHVHYEWQGERMRFHRTGVKGLLEITGHTIRIHMELGFLLRPFRGRIEQEIHSQLNQLIGQA